MSAKSGHFPNVRALVGTNWTCRTCHRMCA